VLPAAGWPEKEGTFSNTERRVQRVRAAVPPPDGAKADWWIFGELAKRMGYDGMSYNNAEEIWDELRRMAPKQFGGLSYAHLEANPGLQWPCPDENHPGTPVLHRNGNFSIAGNKANLFPVLFDVFNLPEEKGKTYTKPLLGRIVEHADAEYPLLLTTGRRIMHYHTGTMTRKSSILDALAPEELIEVNTEDANELSISEGDFIRIDTRRGHIVARATVTDRIQKGLIFGTFHFWEANCNELTSAGVVDPIAGIPEYKISAARLSKSTLADFDAWGVTIRELCGLDLEYKGCKPKPKTKRIRSAGEDDPESDQSRRKYSEKPVPTR
jgi:formate dehydrogenase major subunit